jgi:two-component sensor histidine kinase
LQPAVLYAAALLGALTVRPGDLTSLLFLVISLALASWYGYARNRRVLYIGAIAVYAVCIAAGVSLQTDVGFIAIPHWTVGAGAVIAVFFSFLAAARERVESEQRILEAQVNERTEELRRALDHSEHLRERNRVLLQEVHHRTKNNLQLISSLLSLEQSDPELESRTVSRVLETVRRRVEAMATAHALLHHSDTTSVVGLTQFMKELTNEFVRSGRVAAVVVDAPADMELAVQMDFAVPLGLVVSELIANSTEHAFSDGRHSAVWLSMRDEDGMLAMTIEDQGTEFPEHVSIEEPDTTGLQIVAGLVAQINGTLELEKKPHTKWILQAPFPRAGVVRTLRAG